MNDIKATKVKLLEEFSVYNYTLEYITIYFLGEFSENRMRLLEGYSILYIQVFLAIEYPKDQNQD